MPAYKLRYFNVRGRAEVTRWLFAYAGVEYQDIRVGFGEWKTLKANSSDFPFNQMPVLEVLGDDCKRTVIAQSHAVMRFAARELGLAGKSTWDMGRCDMLDEHLQCAMQALPWTEKDAQKKAQLTKEAILGPITKNFKLLETFVQENGYLVGNDFTYADIHFAAACEFLTPSYPEILDCVPKLKALNEKVRSSPGIAKWIAERPVTSI